MPGKLLLKGEYWLYKNADALIFTKEGDVDHITEMKWDEKQGGKINLDKCNYINNGVDLELFDQQINSNNYFDRDLEAEKFNIIYTGSLRPMNNIDLILDTAKLLKEYSTIQFLVYGDGNQREDLEQRIKNEGIENVLLKGYVNKIDIPQILSKSNLNILNYSDKYGWKRGNSSNKLFEYMASGVPIISTVKMGYDLLERYNCGISLPKTTAEDLKNGVLYFYNMDQNLRNEMGKNVE